MYVINWWNGLSDFQENQTRKQTTEVVRYLWEGGGVVGRQIFNY